MAVARLIPFPVVLACLDAVMQAVLPRAGGRRTMAGMGGGKNPAPVSDRLAVRQ